MLIIVTVPAHHKSSLIIVAPGPLSNMQIRLLQTFKQAVKQQVAENYLPDTLII
ncbi:hypothetical protein [Mangrovibacter sp. MFB070]|uniref:hypothetical protein n=1 Tax=Mangrovibacter sp. MFB070 TaxID=1224318 RepID=UPI00190FAC7D|nr:hypothetical protein [Mangrovibacter sp. MFB070]